MNEILNAQNHKVPMIPDTWVNAATLTYNKDLVGVHALKGTAYYADIRVLDDTGAVIQTVTGNLVSTGLAYSVTIPVGAKSVTVQTRPATGANRNDPLYGVEVLCNGMPAGMTFVDLKDIDIAAVRQLLITYAAAVVTVPAAISPFIQRLRFIGAELLNSPNMVLWDTKNLTSMDNMFSSCSVFNQPIGGWNTSNVTNMRYAFNSASAFNQTIKSWDVRKVTDLSYMFFNAKVYNQDLSTLIFKASAVRTNYDQLTAAWNAAYRPKFTG